MYKGSFVIKLRDEPEALAFLEEMEECHGTTWRSGRKPADPIWIEYFDDCEVSNFAIGARYQNGRFTLWYEDWDHMMELEDINDNYKIIPFYKSRIYKF